MSKLDEILSAVSSEVVRAEIKFPEFNSAHEGYAVLLEEVDELWEEVKRNPYKGCLTPGDRLDAEANHRNLLRIEAIQVAAMAVRFLLNVVEKH